MVNSVENPAIESNLSSVPPVNPSPRPDILPTGKPVDATSGATISETLSPTPPVECLSTTNGATECKSSVSPEFAIAIVRSIVSCFVIPRRYTAMSHADIW